MKDIVRLKSYPNGIRIVIAEDALFGDVLAEVSEKFKDSERFFGKAKLAVTFEGRKNTQEEEDAILDTIRQESSVNIVCVVEKEKEESFERPLARIEEMAQGDFAQFYRGSLSGKKILETEQSLIVLGDVCKGSCVVSKRILLFWEHFPEVPMREWTEKPILLLRFIWSPNLSGSANTGENTKVKGCSVSLKRTSRRLHI